MTQDDAITSLAALAHPARLRIFRLLVRAGPQGMNAGDIAAALDMPHSTLSSNLQRLTDAQLTSRCREGRMIRYAAQISSMGVLVDFLMEDCCAGSDMTCTLSTSKQECSTT